jgi:hypothetical protein
MTLPDSFAPETIGREPMALAGWNSISGFGGREG